MLIAVDTAARVLELSQLLDQLWPNEDLSRYNIVLLNYQSWNVINFAKSQVGIVYVRLFEIVTDTVNTNFRLTFWTYLYFINV